MSMDRLDSVKAEIRSHRRDFYGTAAYYTMRSQFGTSAGVAALPLRSLEVTAADADLLSLCMGVDDPLYARWYPLHIRLKGLHITVVTLYLVTVKG